MTAMHRDPYAELLAIGAEINSHYSDLYVRATPEALAVVRSTGWTYELFTSQIDGKTWIDIAFAYTPYWERKQAKA